MPSAEFIEIVELGADTAFKQAPIDRETLTGYSIISGTRVHVQAQWLPPFPDRLYIQMKDGPLRCIQIRRTSLKVGTSIQVVGYRGLTNGRPYLHTVTLRELELSDTIEPRLPEQLAFIANADQVTHGSLITTGHRPRYHFPRRVRIHTTPD